MTFTKDPPRLRTYGAALPEELVGALGTLPGEDAAPAELERVLLAVRASVVAGETHAAAEPRAGSGRRQRRALFRGTLALAKTFAVGAGAGVLVVSAVHFVPERGSEPPRAASSAASSPSASQPSVSTRPKKTETDSAPPAESAAPPVDVPPPPHAVAVSPSVRPSAASSAPGTPNDELQLLARARAALDSDAGRALALTSDHERRFPRGALAQEREVIAIDALLRLGRRAAASARAERFRRLYPTSVHERRIDVLLNPPAP